MKAKLTLVVILGFISCQAISISATATNTDFSKSMNLEPSVSYRGTIDTSELYFSIDPKLNTNIEFEFEDTEGQYLEFCIYHGDGESDLIECIGYVTKATTITHSEKAVKDIYYVKVTCTECELEGIDDVPFMIIAEYSTESSNSQFIVISLTIAGVLIVSLTVYILVKKVKRNNIWNSDQTISNTDGNAMEDSNNERVSVVQNITYNIQDSVIAGDLDSAVNSSDDGDGIPQNTL
ncbi:MAG: hypothetical protein VXW14_01515 [Candidatus Thermoplasmatota archaeon]|nr:hypothetical protein [Candidatus Thermoplasmatota archaeon]MEC7254605.1 hypothetical protein [Candidatus Thermoplasmatota archaeon]